MVSEQGDSAEEGRMREHLIIPDCQVKPGCPIDHLTWIGKYIVDMKPDVVINIGDFADMPSLSSYDKGKKAAEGRRIHEDLMASNAAMCALMRPINAYNRKRKKNKEKLYRPELYLTLGNHEARITRAAEDSPELDGLIGVEDLAFDEHGWKVIPFKEILEVDGVCYSHFFYNPKTGRPIAGENLMTRLNKLGFSFTMGHQQGYQSCLKELNNGRIIRGLVAGSCYLHDEDYIGPQGNGHWRGIIYKHEVFDGNYDLMEVSLDYLCRKYEGMPVSSFMKQKYPEVFANSQWLKRLDKRRQGDEKRCC